MAVATVQVASMLAAVAASDSRSDSIVHIPRRTYGAAPALHGTRRRYIRMVEIAQALASICKDEQHWLSVGPLVLEVDHATPQQPKSYADHAEAPNRARDIADQQVIREDANLREQEIPIVNHGVKAARGEGRQLLGLSISHISGNGQELLKKEEHADCHAKRLAFPDEIETKREGNEQLEKRAACNGGSQAERAKQGVPRRMNLHKKRVREVRQSHVAGHFVQKQTEEHEKNGQRERANVRPCATTLA
jgi:hypothetical protein